MLASGAAAQPQCMSIVEPMERLACFERQAAGIGREEISVELIDIPLGDPPALNQKLTQAYARRDKLVEAYKAYTAAGFYAEAQQFAQQIQTLDAALDVMDGNQALNDAVYYNDPRRLTTILSRSSLGPVEVQAFRKGEGVVFTVFTPGGQPLSPQLTEIARDQLSSAIRPFFDAEYRQNMAAIERARDLARAEAEGRALGEASAKEHGMQIGEPTE